ncbi:hypothetical protein GCM10023116_31110 [Kistimonas scapharcae]|uniref:ArsR family transcriptional regulator n=1 Tax=Kistimonas scapharcae TaxID=1036133 RepID=A0ABP8V5W2_9GAMM
MNYQDALNECQRLVILRCLSEMTGYKANESILQNLLDCYGYSLSRDQVKTHMAWLAEQGLITVDTVADIQVATLTARGEDCAAGRAQVPGVKRPRAK